MSLVKTINNDLKQAMIAKDELTVSVLRLIKSAIQNEEIARKTKELSDDDIGQVLATQAKKRKEAIIAFDKGDRQAMAAKEKKELEIIKKYLPEQLTDEEIKKVVQEIIAQAGDGVNFGQVMGQAMGRLKGQADGNQVKQAVKELMEL